MSLRAFDHLIFVVHDLEAGADAFRRLGFTITERADVETGPTENKLVVFSDGSYVEIVRFTDPEMLPKHRFKALAQSGGWAEAVIAVDGLEDIHNRLVDAGEPTSPLRLVSKALEDGNTWEVALSHLGRGVGSPLMPMLAEDRTAHNLRVPDHSTVHPNGTTSISGVTMVALGAAPSAYNILFGTAIGQRFAFGEGREIQHVPATAYAEHLALRGEGILSVSFSRATGLPSLSLSADAIFTS